MCQKKSSLNCLGNKDHLFFRREIEGKQLWRNEPNTPFFDTSEGVPQLKPDRIVRRGVTNHIVAFLGEGRTARTFDARFLLGERIAASRQTSWKFEKTSLVFTDLS